VRSRVLRKALRGHRQSSSQVSLPRTVSWKPQNGTAYQLDAAMSGTVGYSLKGLDMEIAKAFGRGHSNAIMVARLAQGEQEYSEASDAAKKEIIEQWRVCNQ
jgi:hypothetical protein